MWSPTRVNTGSYYFYFMYYSIFEVSNVLILLDCFLFFFIKSGLWKCEYLVKQQTFLGMLKGKNRDARVLTKTIRLPEKMNVIGGEMILRFKYMFFLSR